MRVFGIDPGSERTGYGCVESDGSRHRLVACGAIVTSPRLGFPAQLLRIHQQLAALLAEHRPDCVAVESVFYAANVRSALKLGHARGVAMLAAVEAGYALRRVHAGRDQARRGRIRARREAAGAGDGALLLGLAEVPTPHDAADALAVAICHVHSQGPKVIAEHLLATRSKPKSWRDMKVD